MRRDGFACLFFFIFTGVFVCFQGAALVCILVDAAGAEEAFAHAHGECA